MKLWVEEAFGFESFILPKLQKKLNYNLFMIRTEEANKPISRRTTVSVDRSLVKSIGLKVRARFRDAPFNIIQYYYITIVSGNEMRCAVHSGMKDESLEKLFGS